MPFIAFLKRQTKYLFELIMLAYASLYVAQPMHRKYRRGGSGNSLPILKSTFYGFYCNMFYAYFYCAIQGLLATVVFTLTMFDFFHTIPWRRTKSSLYFLLGVMSGLPEIHLIYGDHTIVNGYSFLTQLPYYLLMGVAYTYILLGNIFFFYSGGIIIFQIRCPEKQHPGKFDNCGNSH